MGMIANAQFVLTFTKKKEKPKGERTSVPRPLSWNIYVKKQC
jgi:hypothetical protein